MLGPGLTQVMITVGVAQGFRSARPYAVPSSRSWTTISCSLRAPSACAGGRSCSRTSCPTRLPVIVQAMLVLATRSSTSRASASGPGTAGSLDPAEWGTTRRTRTSTCRSIPGRDHPRHGDRHLGARLHLIGDGALRGTLTPSSVAERNPAPSSKTCASNSGRAGAHLRRQRHLLRHRRGRDLGIVGESGCGKSVTSLEDSAHCRGPGARARAGRCSRAAIC